MANDITREKGVQELGLDELEQVVGGRKRLFIRALGKNVNVRKGPGTEYPVVAQLGYLDEVPVIGKRAVRDSQGHYWARITTGLSQNKRVEGWVSSQYAEACWN